MPWSLEDIGEFALDLAKDITGVTNFQNASDAFKRAQKTQNAVDGDVGKALSALPSYAKDIGVGLGQTALGVVTGVTNLIPATKAKKAADVLTKTITGGTKTAATKAEVLSTKASKNADAKKSDADDAKAAAKVAGEEAAAAKKAAEAAAKKAAEAKTAEAAKKANEAKLKADKEAKEALAAKKAADEEAKAAAAAAKKAAEQKAAADKALAAEKAAAEKAAATAKAKQDAEAKAQARKDELAAQTKAREDAAAKRREETAAAQKAREDELAASTKAREDAAIKRREDAAAQAKAREDELAAAKAKRDADSAKRKEDAAAAAKKREDDALAAKAKREEDSLKRKEELTAKQQARLKELEDARLKREEDARITKQKRDDDAAAAKMKKDKDDADAAAAKKKKDEDDAAAKKKKDEEDAAIKAKQEETTTVVKKTDPEVITPKILDPDAPLTPDGEEPDVTPPPPTDTDGDGIPDNIDATPNGDGDGPDGGDVPPPPGGDGGDDDGEKPDPGTDPGADIPASDALPIDGGEDGPYVGEDEPPAETPPATDTFDKTWLILRAKLLAAGLPVKTVDDSVTYFRNILKDGTFSGPSEINDVVDQYLYLPTYKSKNGTDFESPYYRDFGSYNNQLKVPKQPKDLVPLVLGYEKLVDKYSVSEKFKNRDSIQKYLQNDVSVAELDERMNASRLRGLNADPNYIKTLQDLGYISNGGDLTNFFLDPEIGKLELESRRQTAAFATEAVRRSGAGITLDTASAQSNAARLTALGYSEAQVANLAGEGYENIAQQLNPVTALSGMYEKTGESASALAPVIQKELESEQFLGMASQRRKKLAEQNIKAFQGQSGMSRFGLSSGSASSIL